MKKIKRYLSVPVMCLMALMASVASPLLRPLMNQAAWENLMDEMRAEDEAERLAKAKQAIADTANTVKHRAQDDGDIPTDTQSGSTSHGGTIQLKEPDNAEYSAEYDPASGSVTIFRKIGGIKVRLPYSMSVEDYQNDAIRHSMMDYWMSKRKETSSTDAAKAAEGDGQKNSLLNSKWEINNELFTSIFGSNQVTMKLQGQASVSLGAQYHRIDNPTLQERMRATTSFDFDQSVQINLNSTVGEKMKLGINYNTQATFDFENEVKLEYNGDEDDIIQDIQAGNVNWSLPGTLIQGSQSLFGFKMDMKFGNLTVTTVFSQKKGESSSITVQNGATAQEFDIDITDYEKNRHFFLNHRFKEIYDQALSRLPTINSGITVNKIEVWVTNKSGNYTDARNILALTDLGETGDNISNALMWASKQDAMPSNDANIEYSEMTGTYASAREPNNTTSVVGSISGMKTGRDYEKIENARMLQPSEYTLNAHLGYISLNSPLNNNEVLAVAYEYTYRGQTYTVGEFSTSGVASPGCLYVKMLKGTTLTPQYKNWDLMMKNVYSLGGYDIKPDDFDLNVVYYNDSTSSYVNYMNEGPRPVNGGLNGQTYLQILNCDRLNGYSEANSDGKYDYVTGITINPAKGQIIFPVREPFGDYMAGKLKGIDPKLADKYAFTALYDSTQVFAKQQTKKNKFRIRGHYQSQNSSDISLGTYNLAQGSVVVTAGGRILTENVDYSVDYSLGRVRILNQSILSSGSAINISFENESAITTQTQTMVGTHLNYEINPDFNIGGTLIHMSEKPLTNKVSYGDEAISNTMLGLNLNYTKKLPFLTKAIDALPLISTKAESSIAIEGEIAKLIAGHSSAINAAYIDDFEGSSVEYDIKAWTGWHLASHPQGSGALAKDAVESNDLSAGFDRAKMAWYTIDPLFLRNMTTTPRHIRNDPDQQSNHYVREVYEDELYPNKESAYGESTNISMLNLVYYPDERGPYNFTTNLTKDGHLTEPETKWAGIQRRLETTDFETANIEYIEFWMMDPFIYNQSESHSGELYINIGSISEDVLKDSRKSFEHGLPVPGETFNCDSTVWGYIPQSNSLVKGFNTDPASMRAQDVGLNGMTSAQERYFYNKPEYPFMDRISQMHAAGDLTDEAYEAIMADPAADDFHYYRGSDYDQERVSIMDRYKKINNPEGNSLPTEYSSESYSTAASNQPDNEDLNDDYTVNESESYYQYRISIRPDSMMVGRNNIADMMETTVKLKNGKKETIKWYQFKIPLTEPDRVVGDISDMSSMQFIRLFATGFQDTCIMRFATLNLVKGEWRKYTESLLADGGVTSAGTSFSTTTVNIEENDRRTPVSYVLPPGVDRVVDPSNPQLRQLNEQSYSIRVTDLGHGDARAVYKTLNMDFRNYKRLKMFIHCEAPEGSTLEDNQVAAFVRIGSDYEDNYYEYEIPLKVTPHGTYTSNSESDRYVVWPEENELNIPLTALSECKLARNDEKRKATSHLTMQDVFTMVDPDNNNNRIRIKGNPSTGDVVVMMVGVRAYGAGTKDAEIWMNELRLTDFNESGGWAARGRMSLQLADLGSVQASGQYSSVGFGSIDQNISERNLDEVKQFDISANMELGKLLGPKSRLSLPVYAAYSKTTATPLYSPYDTDVKMSTVISQSHSKAEEDSILAMSQTTETIKSFNVTNVRVKQAAGKKTTMISPSNLSASYAYSQTKRTDPDTEYDLRKTTSGTIGYNYSSGTKTYTPFKKLKLDNKKFGILKDMTFYNKPTQLSYKWELDRDYQEMQKRNITNPEYLVPLSVTKSFFWNRYLDFRYNITRNLKFSLSTATAARILEPAGPVNKDLYPDEYAHWRDSVWNNIKHFGEASNYQSAADLNWTIPINKLPYLNFLTASAQYKATYQWQKGSLTDDYEWGNSIGNRNNKQLTVMSNFTSLYNKSKTLREIYDTYNLSSSNRNQKKPGTKTVTYTAQNQIFKIGQPVLIKHNLKTTDVSARAFDNKGHGLKGTLKAVDENSAEFTPTMASDKARVVITGTVHEKQPERNVAKDMTLMFLTSIKSINVTYSENNSTQLSGYMPDCSFAGFGTYHGQMRGPGFAFIAGVQDRDFAHKAIDHGWLTTDTTFNEPYAMTHSNSLQIRASLEMFKALKIELTAQRNRDKGLSEYYIFDSNGFAGAHNYVETGSYSMTYNAIRTAFKRPDKKGNMSYSVFTDFTDARLRISNRRYADRRSRTIGPDRAEAREDGGADGFGLNSQDVLIPSFLAAYTGRSASSMWLDFIPSASKMSPNWKVTFSGLGNIPALKDKIRNLEVSHGYTSKLTISQFQSNSEWNADANGLCDVRDNDGSYISRFTATTVSIAEQLNPLINLSATLVNNMTASFGINKSRTLTLNITNAQVTENYSNDWTANVGYRFDHMKLFVSKKNDGFNNTLNLTLGLSQRDSYSILRRIEENSQELASGARTTTIKLSADYALTRKFNIEFYYDQSLSNPYISSSYPTNNINVGFSFQLQLTE